jgi:hypothetical protein
MSFEDRKISTGRLIYTELLEYLRTVGCARFTEILNHISSKHPNLNKRTIAANLSKLKQRIEKGEIQEISHPERGMFCLNSGEIKSQVKEDPGEKDFYEPLAEFLVKELEECTQAVPLGGNLFKDKWGTPDVLGVNKIPEYYTLKAPPEIVSCELKKDPGKLIVAFGQACSYKLFSHKVYLVIPKTSSRDEISRLESLCINFGIGLILFNPQNPENPDFEIRARANKNEPDYFYLNKYLDNLPIQIKRKLFG